MVNNWILIWLTVMGCKFGSVANFPVLNSINLFDGPYTISNAPTKPSTTIQPTLEQMMYYNYYAFSTYCFQDSEDLECEVTKKFKDDVEKHWVLRNAIENTLALVSLSERRKEIVVAYRGTSNASNFILDLFAIKGDERISGIKGIKMHRGFYIATMSLYEDVISAVRHLRSLKPAYKDYKLVICGHSLGGAMARITQYFLHFLNPFADVKLEVYTYGEPRSGNKDFVDYLNGKTDVTARVCSRADFACHLPPTILFPLDDPFVHVQTEYFIDGMDNQRFCNKSMYEDRNCSMALGPMYSALDHGKYFDVDITKCCGSTPHSLASLPSRTFELTKVMQPLPKQISDFFTATAHFVGDLLSPVFRRTKSVT